MLRSSLAATILLLASAGHAEDVPLDPYSGFKMTGDWELVRSQCIACHSAKLVTQQRGTREQWLGLIRWMQARQNLWQFQPDIEERIIGYLAENYAPDERRRRAAIPPDLMPPNPYAPPTQEPDDAGQSL